MVLFFNCKQIKIPFFNIFKNLSYVNIKISRKSGKGRISTFYDYPRKIDKKYYFKNCKLYNIHFLHTFNFRHYVQVSSVAQEFFLYFLNHKFYTFFTYFLHTFNFGHYL